MLFEKQLAIGVTITQEMIEQASNLPPEALARIWLGHTLNTADVLKIKAAVAAANEEKTIPEMED